MTSCVPDGLQDRVADSAALTEAPLGQRLKIKSPCIWPRTHWEILIDIPQDRIADIAALMEAARARAPGKQQPSAIVYTLKRDTASEVAAALTRKGGDLVR